MADPVSSQGARQKYGIVGNHSIYSQFSGAVHPSFRVYGPSENLLSRRVQFLDQLLREQLVMSHHELNGQLGPVSQLTLAVTDQS